MPRRPYAAGLLFSLALFKPHIALPFMLWPFFRGQWRTLMVAGVTQAAGLFAAAWWVRASPLDLVRHWLGISPYMFQGAYTIQEFVLAAGLSGSILVMLVPPAFLLLCAAWTWRHRRACEADAVAFLALVSVFWVYHERYDFIVLLLPIALFLANLPDGRDRAAAPGLTAFLLVAFALSDFAYLNDQKFPHVLRWTGRLALYGLIAYFAWRLRRAARVQPPAPAPA